MTPKIYFRADADSIIGYGHFVRTLALAAMLKEDFDCSFFTAEPTAYQRTEVEKVCKLRELPCDERKFKSFCDLLTGEEIVFLDNYFFTPDYEKAIKNIGCKLVVLSPSKPHHYADIVINFVDKDITHYSVEEYSQVVAGLEWSILREPFRQPVIESKRKNNNAVISFGGTDQYSLTERVVEVLGTTEYQLSVICTSRVSEGRRVSLVNKGVKVYTDIPAETVAELFEQAEYAILSSSTVCLEALSRGAKVLAGHYVDNQVSFYKVLMNEHCITGLGDLLDVNSFEGLKERMSEASMQSRLHIDFINQKEKYISLFKSLCR